MSIFKKILVILGLRKRAKTRKSSNKGILNFLKRKIISVSEYGTSQPQPRYITRAIYENVYNKVLSPRGNQNHEVVIEGLNNMGENNELNLEFKRKENREKIKSNIFSITSWFYTIFINLILYIKPTYTMVYIIQNFNTVSYYAPTMAFDFVIPIQYTLSIFYFSKDHLEKFYIENEPNINKKFPDLDKIVAVSLCLAIITIVYSISTVSKIPNFENFQQEYKIFVYILIPISSIFGTMSLFIHSAIFSFTFIKHLIILKKFIHKLVKHGEETSVNEISIKVLEIKYSLEKSISNFKNFFSVVTLACGISIGFLLEILIKQKTTENYPWASFVFYGLFQIIFMIIIIYLDEYKEKLFKYMRSGEFVQKYLYRYNQKEITHKFNNNMELILLNIEEENASTIDWLVLNSILSEGWNGFSILGININDLSLVKRGITLVILILTIQNYFG